ncbi:MAG TPA: hypothetical protein VF623_12160 [Segetibacter sp.]|jgi:hypothetical protein
MKNTSFNMPDYTTEELIQYVYQETTGEQTLAIEKALQTDWNLQERLNALKDSKTQLDTAVRSPRPQSIMAILNYARASSVVEQS